MDMVSYYVDQVTIIYDFQVIDFRDAQVAGCKNSLALAEINQEKVKIDLVFDVNFVRCELEPLS